MMLFLIDGDVMTRVSEYDKKILNQIIYSCTSTYNCYKEMAELDSFGLKDSDQYKECIKLIDYNHKEILRLFDLLSIVDVEQADNYFDYVCNECKILEKVKCRVLFQLEQELNLINFEEDEIIDEYDIDTDFEENDFEMDDSIEDENLERKSGYLGQLLYSLVMVDFDFIYVNELKQYFESKCSNNIILNMCFYDKIYSNFNLEEVLIDNNFNFDNDKYLYGKFRSELLFKIRDDFDDIEDFDDIYQQSILEAAVVFLGKTIKFYQEKKNDCVYRSCLICSLISVFIMMDISNLEEFIYIFDSCYLEFCNLLRESDECRKIFNEAFSIFKSGKSKYKRLSLY